MPNSPTGEIEAATSRDILESLAASECILTAKQLAKLLAAVGPKTLYSYVSRNLIPHYKIETNVRFPPPPMGGVCLSGPRTRWNENLGWCTY